jgi:hypothetical protein
MSESIIVMGGYAMWNPLKRVLVYQFDGYSVPMA